MSPTTVKMIKCPRTTTADLYKVDFQEKFVLKFTLLKGLSFLHRSFMGEKGGGEIRFLKNITSMYKKLTATALTQTFQIMMLHHKPTALPCIEDN